MSSSSPRGPLDLETVVRSHVPLADIKSHRRAGALLDSSSPPWSRSEFEPGHFTASGFVVSPDGASLLLIHHAKLGRWLQPGGHIELDDETVEAAARREVLEETGVEDLERLGDGLVRIDVHPIPARGSEPAHLHFDLGIAFHAKDETIGPIHEVLDARWVRFDDLGEYDADSAVTSTVPILRGYSTS